MIEFAADYYDGISSKRQEVTVRVDNHSVLHLDGLAEAKRFPIQEIKISPRLGNTVRSLFLPDGSKCETRDNAAVDAAQDPYGIETGGRWIHRLEASWRYALAALLLVVAILVGGFTWGIPALARQAAHAIPAELAFEIGKGVLTILDETALDPSSLDAETRERLREGFGRMAENYPDLPLELQFRSGFGANAFALPDGTVVATDGLVELAEKDEQVYAVLAHEIGHVHHRHGLRTALEDSAVALLIATVLGDVSSLTAIPIAAPTIFLDAHYSRDREWEADGFALDYMRANELDPNHFADIMELLTGPFEEDGSSSYLSSHPPTKERTARFR